jgi:hypothetical protein
MDPRLQSSKNGKLSVPNFRNLDSREVIIEFRGNLPYLNSNLWRTLLDCRLMF